MNAYIINNMHLESFFMCFIVIYKPVGSSECSNLNYIFYEKGCNNRTEYRKIV